MKKSRKDNLIKLRVTDEQKNKMQLRADIYANGNLSEWARYCLENFEPKFLNKKTRSKRKRV